MNGSVVLSVTPSGRTPIFNGVRLRRPLMEKSGPGVTSGCTMTTSLELRGCRPLTSAELNIIRELKNHLSSDGRAFGNIGRLSNDTPIPTIDWIGSDGRTIIILRLDSKRTSTEDFCSRNVRTQDIVVSARSIRTANFILAVRKLLNRMRNVGTDNSDVASDREDSHINRLMRRRYEALLGLNGRPINSVVPIERCPLVEGVRLRVAATGVVRPIDGVAGDEILGSNSCGMGRLESDAISHFDEDVVGQTGWSLKNCRRRTTHSSSSRNLTAFAFAGPTTFDTFSSPGHDMGD